VNIKIDKIDSPFNLVISDIASDKSISHRSAIFAMLSNKKSIIKNFLFAEDTKATLEIIQQLGGEVEYCEDCIKITPPIKLIEPSDVLNCKNSGTGLRLLSGFLAGFGNGLNILTGDKYLNIRPVSRVVDPLKKIGANISGRNNDKFAPIVVSNSKIAKFDYSSPIASAQVKSCMILSALSADGESYYKESELSRDHTERMLVAMGVDIETLKNGKIKIVPPKFPLKALDINIPADPSSAFFFAVAVAITPKSKVVLKNVSLNPTRIEAYKVLQKMGVKINFIEHENIYEPIGDIMVEYSQLHGTDVEVNISWLIDEIPALSIAFACASSKSIVKNAKELRVKESDRIDTIITNLQLCGVNAVSYDDGFCVLPSDGKKIAFANINSFGDHRIAMSFAIAGIIDGMSVNDIKCIETSFPDFIKILSRITKVKF
jgi:3-phosphoshikimate 1-carboxyvinyltransferase